MPNQSRSLAASSFLMRFLHRLYLLQTGLLYPFLYGFILMRRQKGKEHPVRYPERFGKPSMPRPAGTLVWLHAASVGESILLLPFLTALRTHFPHLTLLLTTGTVTSAQLMEKRLPEGVLHQFVPIDAWIPMQRFIRHWQPDLALLTESEWWPCLLYVTARQCPLLLISARISDRSFRRWHRFPRIVQHLLSHFDALLAGGNQDLERLQTLLGVQSQTHHPALARLGGNLKFTALPLTAPSDFAAITASFQGRNCWLAASTHADEEMQVASAHVTLSRQHPSLLTIIVPRHPHRATEIQEQIQQSTGLTVQLRSEQRDLQPGTAIYIADTMGELGLFYRFCDIVFVGGSLIPHGGQNILEPARLDSAILVGPHTHNFREIIQDFKAHEALIEVKNATELSDALASLLSQPERLMQLKTQAKSLVTSQNASIIDTYIALVAHYLI